ncbi:hypothetical protein [Leeuwenhoekiella sp. W20_SRS_FM14]|uniref:hypothetical protein n=1 Tax=Leeuwenhoekiella sp. W20_SRS_FM14 TaxID=3240270 RepID=UPI003F94C827
MSLKTWLRNLIGFDRIEKNLIESQMKILNQYNSLTSEIEELKKQPPKNEVRYFQSYNEDSDSNEIGANTDLQVAKSFSLAKTDEQEPLTFSLLENSLVASDWLEVSTSPDQKSSWANIFSGVTGAGSLGGSAIQSAKGFYTTTANPASLIKYKDGTLSSITEGAGKKFGKHQGFQNAGASAFTPLIIFQMASMITGQYYFNNLSKQLNKVLDKLDNLTRMHHIERESKMKYAYVSLKKYAERRYFVVEDFVHLEHIAYDLQTIREEYVISSIEKMQEINKLLLTVDVNNIEIETILDEEATVLEKGRNLFSKGMTSIKNSKAVGAVKTGIDSAGNILGSTYKKVEKINQKIEDLGLLYSLKSAVTAEELYQMTQLIELKMSMSVTNMDADRLGRIDELKSDIEGFTRKDLIYDSLKNSVEEFNQKLDNRFAELKQQSILAKTDIDTLGKKSRESFESFFEICDSSYRSLETMNADINLGFQKTNEIMIDNTGKEPKLFIKNNI